MNTLLEELEEARLEGVEQRKIFNAEKAETDRLQALKDAQDIINHLPAQMKRVAKNVGQSGGKLETTVLHHLEYKHAEAIELIENWLKENGIKSERRCDFNQEDGEWHDLIAFW